MDENPIANNGTPQNPIIQIDDASKVIDGTVPNGYTKKTTLDDVDFVDGNDVKSGKIEVYEDADGNIKYKKIPDPDGFTNWAVVRNKFTDPNIKEWMDGFSEKLKLRKKDGTTDIYEIHYDIDGPNGSKQSQYVGDIKEGDGLPQSRALADNETEVPLTKENMRETTEDATVKCDDYDRCLIDGTGCFMKGTLVMTPDEGLRPLEDFELGDEVWAFNEKIQTQVKSIVTDVLVKKHHRMCIIQIGTNLVNQRADLILSHL